MKLFNKEWIEAETAIPNRPGRSLVTPPVEHVGGMVIWRTCRMLGNVLRALSDRPFCFVCFCLDVLVLTIVVFGISVWSNVFW